jgi:hypothetical protein
MLIIKNANIYSVNLDGTEIRAEAVAADDGKIVYVGSNEGIRDYESSDAKVIDAQGRTVLPGLCDAHVHATWSGSAKFSCDLFYLAQTGGKKSIVEKIQERLCKYIKENPDKKMIKGCGWDYFDFIKALPNKKMIDEVCLDKPVFLESYCQHHIWLNSKALEMAGITKDTPNPHMGLIWRDKNGEPTGLLSEFSAINIVKEGIPDYDYTVEEYKEIIQIYQHEYAHAYGVTMIFDALSTENGKKAYRELAREGKLKLRVRDNYYADTAKPRSQFDDMIAEKGSSDVADLYQQTTVKFFMESGTPDMYLTRPYNPLALIAMKRPFGHRGFPHWTAAELQEIMPKLADAGFQLHTHAMGDGSVKHTLDGYINAQNVTGKRTRNVIAHLMLVQPDDFTRMAENDIIACVQPTWTAMTKGEYATIRLGLGKKRAEQLYPYGRFLKAGVLVSAGTDFPVMPPPDPFIDMQHAMTRKPCKRFKDYANSKDFMLAPKKNPAQDLVKLTDVIKSRTICGAYQSFAEEYAGSIEIGKSADFAILDRDLFHTPIEDICETKVMMTIFKGEIVFEREYDHQERANLHFQ